MANSLIDNWISDQQVAFRVRALRPLLEVAGDPLVRRTRDVLIRSLAAQPADLSAAQHATKQELFELPLDLLRLSSRTGKQLADAIEAVRSGMPKAAVNATLLANAVTLLSGNQVSLADFGKWAKRASPRSGAVKSTWSKAYWSEFLRRVSKDPSLDDAMSILRSAAPISVHIAAAERLASLDRAPASGQGASTPKDGPWLLLSHALFARQMCWPLLAVRIGSAQFGMSLPMGLELVEARRGGGANDVSFECSWDGQRSGYVKGTIAQQDSTRVDRFDAGCLSWELPFLGSFATALKVAKALWQSQNGRGPEEQKRVVRESRLVVDMTLANRIISMPGLTDFLLEGRSAELHLTQLLLAKLLRAPMPSGVATGVVDATRSTLPVRWVEDIPSKVRFARQAAFPRVVLPSVAYERLEGALREALASDQDNARMEVNYCPTARSAADAMQRAGWRRTTFIQSPEARLSFYVALGRLHANAVAEGRVVDPESVLELDPDVRTQEGQPLPFTQDRIYELEQQTDAWLMQGQAAVRWIALNRADARPRYVGHWLAWLDHCTRIAPQDETGPGLGILCVRLRDDDSEMRVWARLFDQLDVNPKKWAAFQWASASRAREILAEVLNNFDVDPAISSTPPPDLIVVIDESGMTRHRTNEIFDDDFRGQMRDVLTRDLGNLLDCRDDARRRVLGATRILILQPGALSEVPPRLGPLPSERNYALSRVQQTIVQRLAIFRSGFTVQAAWVTLNWRSSASAAQSLATTREGLDELVALQVLGRHRGEYFLRWEFLYQYASHPPLEGEHLAAATALAPVIDPDGRFPATNRDSLFDSWAIHEAVWHLQQANRQLSPRRQIRRTSVLEGSLDLLSLMPYPDWDLVRPLLSLKTPGRVEALELVQDLLKLEEDSQKPPKQVHPSRHALAIHVLARRARDVKNSPAALQKLADQGADWFDTAWAAIGSRQGSAEAVKVLSEYALLLRMTEGHSTAGAAQRIDLEARLDVALSAFWSGRRDARDVPLSRDWVRERVHDTTRDLRSRCKDARIACELWGHDWIDPWVWLMGLLQSSEFDVAEIAKVLLWFVDGEPDPPESMREFAEKARLQAWTSRPRKLGLDVAVCLKEWLFDSPTPLQGKAAQLAVVWIGEWISESHNCFDFAEQIKTDFLLDGVLVARESAQSRLAEVVLRNSWGCWSLLSQLYKEPSSLDKALGLQLLRQVYRLAPRPFFAPSDHIVEGREDEKITKWHIPPSQAKAKADALSWIAGVQRACQDAGDMDGIRTCKELGRNLSFNV